MKILFRIIPILILSLALFSCHKYKSECEGDPIGVNTATLLISFKDSATGRYLYAETSPVYNKDSLVVKNATGIPFQLHFDLQEIPGSALRQFVPEISFYEQATDSFSFHNEICKFLFVQYSSTSFDTLNICFKSKDLGCGASKFETFSAYHKGALILANTNSVGGFIMVTKY